MNLSQFQQVFPVGSHLCREPMPAMSELKRDMENLKRHGFNMIKLQESWKTDEPEEGKYDFSALNELIEYAAHLDLGVYLGLSMEHAPSWLWQKYPGARMIDSKGIPMLYEAQETIPADGKPGPCFDDPGAMEAHLQFIRRLVADLGRHENIIVWNTWQEMGYEGARICGHKVCYCPQTIAAFQAWLREEFGSLEALNLAWRSRYTRWEDVVPNRDVARFCLSNNIAYEYFLENVRIARILKRRADVIRESDPLHRPVFAHQGSPTVGSGIDWNYAKSQDFLGCSCYPAWFHLHGWDDLRHERDRNKFRSGTLLNEAWESVALKFDYLRGCNAAGSPLWGAEFQGGPICTGLYKGRVPSGADLRRWMLTAVASGANAISYWVTRAEIQGHEINGYSLLDSGGDTTERYEEASRVAQALNRNPEYFQPGNVPQAPAAILVNERNYKLCEQLKGDAEEHLMYSTRGWYSLLWAQGVPVDFVEVSQLDEAFVKDYRLLILPFPLSLSEEIGKKLTAYVAAGGRLVSEACPGRFDPSGFGNRGELSPAMRELFGVEHSGLTLVEEPDGGERWRMYELGSGDYADSAVLKGEGTLSGLELRPNLYLESFRCTGSEPLMTCDGEIYAVSRRTGDGEAWLFGTFIGHGGTAYRDSGARELATQLLASCGIEAEHKGKLLLRRLEKDGKTALCLTNPTTESVTETVAVPDGCLAETLFSESLKPCEGGVSLTVQPMDVAVVLIK